MHPPIPPPSPRHILPALLACLPAAAVSSQPPTALLPLLSPILRQRVQLLSAASNDPWLPLLCYDHAKASKLSDIAKSDRFECHPVSGEVEVDWDTEVETGYRRIDKETLQALVSLQELDLIVKLLWCTGDQEGGGDGWRIGEVSVLDSSTPTVDGQQGCASIGEAEGRFKEATSKDLTSSRTSDALKPNHTANGKNHPTQPTLQAGDEEDDDAYWAQYDNTPARTPAPKQSPAPDSLINGSQNHGADEDAYYAQYASVQPAMDSHDQDEAQTNGGVETTLGHDEITHELHQNLSNHPDFSESSRAWTEDFKETEPLARPYTDDEGILVQPRPSSSGSSSGEDTVAKLERTASAQVQSEIGVKQHISFTVKSLYRLARTAGIERAEFERVVRTELDVLGLLEEDD